PLSDSIDAFIGSVVPVGLCANASAAVVRVKAAKNGTIRIVLFFILVLDFSAPDHPFSAIGIGDRRRCLHPIFVQHWAVCYVIAALTDCYRLGARAEFFEPSSRIL